MEGPTIDVNDNNNSNNNTPPNKRKRHGRRRRRGGGEKLDKKNAKIVIIGSGLAGLSVAISLQQAGFTNIHIYERDISLDSQKEGYGLTLTYNPKGPLAKLGLLEKVAQHDCPSRSHYVFKPDGTIMGYFGNTFYKYRDGKGQRGNLRVPRKVLRKMLIDTIIQNSTTITINWGYRFINATFQEKKLNNNCIDDDNDNNNNGRNGDEHIIEFEKYQQIEESNGDDNNNNKPTNTNTTTTTTTKTNIEYVTADLIVAADGIRSSVLDKLVYQNHNTTNVFTDTSRKFNIIDNNDTKTTKDNNNNSSSSSGSGSLGLRRMGVRLILGISDFDHPLLNERGFYTLDGKHRLFTMPYESDKFNTYDENDDFNNNNNNEHGDDNVKEDRSSTSIIMHNNQKKKKKKANRIMWQLSFATSSNDDSDDDDDNDDSSTTSSSLNKNDLQSYVLETCRSWHNPVFEMIQATPKETIWGTDLMDRDPREVLSLVQKQNIRRLVVVGDALHSMSPFKGQGANQALTDGPLLAKWLSGSAVDSALVGFWRETVQRTAPVVTASHQAAKELHSSAVISSSSSHGFAGIQPDKVDEFLVLLHNRKIGANLEGDLDKTVAKLLSEFPQMAAQDDQEPVCLESQTKALGYANLGDTQGLRILSLAKRSRSIRSARQQNTKKTCLHLAMECGYVETCRWLLTEVGCDPTLVDQDGKTYLDYATTQSAKTLLSKLC